MTTLQGRITTKLNRKKLERETSYIQHEDSAGMLLNGVNHMYGRITLNRERERMTNTDGLHDDGVDDVIDEVMEYEPESLVPNIDDVIFASDDGVDDDGADDEEEDLAINVSGEVQRPCLMDLVKVGRDKLREMNVKKVRMVAYERARRKRASTHYILARVASMKQDMMGNNIPSEQDDVEHAEWVSYLHELRGDYYQD